jgi:ATP-dependent protease ClpP protease subunit
MKLLINNVISRYYGISESDVFQQLQGLTPGEELEVVINSPGGDVYTGVAIFNHLREVAKTHKVTVRINGLAASMASYISIAARTVDINSKLIVSENSVFLIHNPWNVTIGDHREMAKMAEFLEKLAAMLGSTYSYISKKTETETRFLMDAETYYVGEEIIENGFGNTLEKINQTENDDNNAFSSDKNALIINAKLRMEKMQKEIQRNNENVIANTDQAVALLNSISLPSGMAPGNVGAMNNPVLDPSQVSSAGIHLNSSQGEKSMTIEEFRKQNPELYAAIFAEGKDAGVKDERSRVGAHLKLGEDCGNVKVAVKFITEGKSVMENDVQAEYLSARMNSQALNNALSDNVPPLNPASGEGADAAALEAAWNNGLAGRDTKGKAI